MYFYNWAIAERCYSPRLPVVATVTAPPALTLSVPTTTICSGVTSNAIQVTTPVVDFDTYTWSPATGVTGTTAAQFNPTQSGVYTLTALNNTTRCANTATLNVTVNPLPIAPITGLATPEICVGNVQTLESRPAPGTSCRRRLPARACHLPHSDVARGPQGRGGPHRGAPGGGA
ncbi:MAG: putative adhesin [Bacteroidota bacterium]